MIKEENDDAINNNFLERRVAQDAAAHEKLESNQKGKATRKRERRS
jgi:hypothetical protein